VCESSFSGAVVVMEDSFELWTNSSPHSNQMASGKWTQMGTAQPRGDCGAHRGDKALVFNEASSRYSDLTSLEEGMT